MEELRSAALACALFGGVHDLLTHKIPNWFTFPAIAIGLIANIYFLGAGGLGDSLLGIVIPFLFFLPLFYFGHVGAGDIKLLMAVGAFGGMLFSWQVVLASVMAGGAFAFVEVVWRGRLFAVIKSVFRFVLVLVTPVLVAEPIKLDRERKFPFGIFITIGAGIVFVMRLTGGL